MQISIDITGIPEIMRGLNAMREDLQAKASSAALNKVGAKANTEMKRAITSEYNLKASEVSSHLRLQRASRNSLRVVLDPFASGRING
jgi:hypothetical protein